MASDEQPKRRRGRPRKTDSRRRPEPVPTEEVVVTSAGVRCPACGRGATLRVDHTREIAHGYGLAQYGTCSLCGRRICRKRSVDGRDTMQVLP